MVGEKTVGSVDKPADALLCRAVFVEKIAEHLSHELRVDFADNEFSISMDVTKSSKDFFKEAIKMEDYYRTRWIEFGLRYLYYNHYLTDEEISVLPPEIISFIHT